MTRINVVPPSELSGPHLVAEYRELPRVFALSYAAQLRGERADDPRNPTEYVLGSGHVRFFYPRLGWCRDRFAELVAEMHRRGYRTTYEVPPAYDHSASFVGGYEATPEALSINRARIRDRTRPRKEV